MRLILSRIRRHIITDVNRSSCTVLVIMLRYERKSIIKLQIVIEKKLMGIMAYKKHLFFNVISIQI
jgi:hypothetical protein